MYNFGDLESKYSSILLNNGINDEIKEVITKIPDSLVGTHMASICQHVTVHFKNTEKIPMQLFWKQKLSNPNPRTDEAMGRIIRNEGVILTYIVPEMSEFCRRLGQNDNLEFQQMFPLIYYTDDTNLVMENLTYKGYQMPDRMKGHDLEDAKLVLQSLAKLHAVSYAWIQEFGGKNAFLEKYRELKEPMFNPGAEQMLSMMFDPPFSGVLGLLKNSPVENSQTAFAKLEKYDGKFASTYVQVLREQNILNVMNHGDCWSNNIMLSGSKGECRKLIFVDFQIARITSPNVDIGFYLFSSCLPEVRKQWKSVLKFYYDAFQGILQTLKVDCNIRFEKFEEDFKEKSRIGFLFGILMSACKGAIRNHNTSKSDGKIEQDFTRLFHRWIEEHPEKSQEIVSTVIEIVENFELITLV